MCIRDRDSKGRACYRLALQTREQHIRREKATSNICTAQALLAIMSSFYAIYHGPNGLKSIASDVKEKTLKIANELSRKGYVIKNNNFFDTLVVELENPEQVHLRAKDKKINLRVISEKELGLSFDEMTTDQDVNNISELFEDLKKPLKKYEINWDKSFDRKTEYLNHEVFNSHHSETQILRYIRSLSDKDIALDRCMIPLGSCTMKLNATSEMIPVGWNGFANVHPHAPTDQTEGYQKINPL